VAIPVHEGPGWPSGRYEIVTAKALAVKIVSVS
jgi:hypothetical protein